MDYQEDLEWDSMEFEVNLRELIMKSKEFKERFPNLDLDSMKYSEEEQEALNLFKRQEGELYNKIKVEVEVDFALMTLRRRCNIELYKRLKLPIAKEYWDKEDVISVCSDNDLITLLNLIEKIRMK